MCQGRLFLLVQIIWPVASHKFKELNDKSNNFLPTDSIVIRNLKLPQNDDDELPGVKEVLGHLSIDNFDADEDIVKIERKGKKNGKLGSVFVKISNEVQKRQIMKTKNELRSRNQEIKELKIMNYKMQEHILFENALRNFFPLMPEGHLYEFIGNMRLVLKK